MFHDGSRCQQCGSVSIALSVQQCIPLVGVFLRVHHNHCTVNLFFRPKINDTISRGPTPGLIDESRRAVFKCVSVNTVRPV